MDDTLTIYGLAAEYNRRHPDDIPLIVAAKALSDLSTEQKRSLLVRAIAQEVETVRRVEARRIEREAFATSPDATPRPHGNSREYREWLLTPEGQAAVANENETKAWQEERRAGWRIAPWTAPRNTVIYRDWVANTDDGRAYEAKRLEREAEEAEKERLWREDPLEYDRRYGWSAMWQSMKDAAETFRQHVRQEFAAELLASSFALGDGRAVTWGQATLEDHRQRVDLLRRHVEGNVKTIQLHEHAAAMLRESGAKCLNEYQNVVAA